MRTGESAATTQKNVPWPDFSRLFGQARAVLLLGVSCFVLPSACDAATGANPTTTFALNASHAMREMVEIQIWKRIPPSEERMFITLDNIIAYRAAAMVRYEASGEELAALRKLVRLRAGQLGMDTPAYFRKALTTNLGPGPANPNAEWISESKGFIDFTTYFSSHSPEAEQLARDLARAIEGEHVDLTGRLGAQERDIEIEMELRSLFSLWTQSFDSLRRHIYSIEWVGSLDAWAQMRLGISYEAPSMFYVKDAAARDDFARLFYLCWERYLSRPDEYALRERYEALGVMGLVAYNPHPTATDETMRQKLGVDPEKWKAFQQFTKDVRAGLWNDRLYPKGR